MHETACENTGHVHEQGMNTLYICIAMPTTFAQVQLRIIERRCTKSKIITIILNWHKIKAKQKQKKKQNKNKTKTKQ